MNRIYRLVFNHALRLWQVASELVQSPRGGTTGGRGAAVGTLPPLRFAMYVALGFVMTVPAFAQAVDQGRILVDRSAPGTQRPTVVEAPNGTPVVNITTPSAAGVSRNNYSQFDVGTQGVILNNSRTNADTQLGGGIEGNPWLARGTARVILNEVNGPASQLNGYVEVGGDRAQVIIANPAGIQVNGGGFLNASRATLTTGTPVLNSGNLDGYRVEGGAIRVDGAGLDATHTDYTDLIARSLEVNAGVWANQLQATLGANVVSADHTQTTATGSTPVAPQFALDVSALGGMYANKIQLVGNEHGVGVRSAGDIGAMADDLTVTADGRIENTGTMQARRDARIDASGGVANAGTISASRELTINTPTDLHNSGGTLNARRIEVNAASLRNRDGSIEQTGLQALALNGESVSNRDGGRIGLAEAVAGGGNSGGTSGGSSGGSTGGGEGGSAGGGSTGGNGGTLPDLTPLANGALNIAGELNNDGGKINAGGGVGLNTATGINNDGGHLGLGQLTITQGDLFNNGGELIVSGDTSVHVDRIGNDAGRLEIAGAMDLAAQSLSSRSGAIVHSGTSDASIAVAGTFDNSDGTLESNASRLTVNTGALVNERGTIQHAGANGLALQIGDAQTNAAARPVMSADQTIIAGRNLWLPGTPPPAGALIGAGGRIVTAGTMTLNAHVVDHRGATLSATQLSITANDLDNADGQIIASGNAANTLRVFGVLNNTGGLVASSADLTLRAGWLNNTGGTLQHAGDGTFALDATRLYGTGGTLVSNGALAVTGHWIGLDGGATQAQRIGIAADMISNRSGKLTAFSADPLSLTARDTLDNTGGTVQTSGVLNVTAGTLINRDTGAAEGEPARGLLSTAAMTLDAQRIDNAHGTLAASGDATVRARDVDNTGGAIQASGALRINAADRLGNDNGSIAASGDTALTAITLDNVAGTIQHGGTGTLAIDAATLNGSGGTIASNGALSIAGTTTDLRDATTFAQRVAIDTTDLTTAGGALTAIGTDAMSLIARDALDNTGGAIQGNGALAITAGNLTNVDGTLSAAGTDASALHVDGLLDNTRGTLATAGMLGITARMLINRDTGNPEGSARGIAAQSLHIDAGIVDNANGRMGAGESARVKAGLLTNTDGTITAENALTVDARLLQGQGGTLGTNGALTLTGSTLNLRDGTTFGTDVRIDSDRLTTAGGTLTATGTDPLSITARDTLDNTGGAIQSNGALNVSAGTLINRDTRTAEGGQARGLLSSGAMTLDVQRVDNTAGLLATSAVATVRATDLINQGGALQAGDTLTVTAAGLLDNSAEGVIAGNGDTTLTAATLDNTGGTIQHAGDGTLDIDATTLTGTGGTIASNGALSITGTTTNLRDATTSAQSISVDTTDLTTASGTLTAASTDLLRITARGTLDNTGGAIQGNGALDLQAGALNNTDGTVIAAGSNAAQVRVTNGFVNTRGTLTTAGTLTAHAGSITNSAGTIQSGSDGTLTLTSDGHLANNGGTIAGNGAIDLTAASVTNANGVVQSLHAVTANVVGTLDNTAGTIASGDSLGIHAGALINRDTFDPSAEAGAAPKGLFGRTVTLDAGTLDNTRGQIQSNESLTLTGGDLANVGGSIGGAGAVSVNATSFDNSDGQLVQYAEDGTLAINTTGALTNARGQIGSLGSADVHAASLDNTAGTVFGWHALNVRSDGDLINRDGGYLSAGQTREDGITLGALNVQGGGRLDNTGGALDATGNLAVNAGTLTNAGGQIVAGTLDDAESALTLTTGGSLDNRGGTLASRGGDVQVNADALDNRADGRVVAKRDMTLTTNSVNNDAGTVFAERALRFESANGTLDNGTGTFGAGDNATLTLANVSNATGGRIQAGILTLTTLNLHTDGEITGNVVHAQLANLSGTGRLYGAQELDAKFSGDYTYGTGPRLESDVKLGLNVTGALTNTGTLQTPGELALSATSVINEGTINASSGDGSGYAHISAGNIENRRGASIEGDWLELNADVVNNTGEIVGDNVTITADTLTNGQNLGTALAAVNYGEGFIGASQELDIYANRLANRDGDIFSAGNLFIGGRDAARAVEVANISGRIQAEGNAWISADSIRNERRMLAVETYTLSADEAYALGTQKTFDEAWASLSPAELQAFARMSQSPPQPSGLSPADETAMFRKLGWVPVADIAALEDVGAELKQKFNAIYLQRAIDQGHRFGEFVGAIRGEIRQEDVYVTGQRLDAAATSAEGQIVTGGALTLDTGGAVRNYASRIAAGRNLTIAGAAFDPNSSDPRVENIAFAGQYEGTRTIHAWTREGTEGHAQKKNGDWFTNYKVQEGTSVTRARTFDGPSLADATITAGGGVSIEAARLDNTAVTAGTGPGGISGGDVGAGAGTNAGSAASASTGTVDGPGAAQGGTVNGATGPGAAQGGTVNDAAGPGSAQGGSVTNQTGPAGAASQTVGTPERPLPGLVPPDNGRFKTNTDPNSPYLVTTAPRFAKGDTAGSEYLMARLGVSTDLHKRLGDGYYEQQLVQDQILQLTGRRSLGGDPITQYRDLMDAAASEAARLGMPLGAPLTSDQIASLSQDIVWLVEQEVNGQKVLVPVVYLSKATAERLAANGALIDGDTLDVRSTGTLRNDGTLSGSKGAWLSADTLINDGAIHSGGQVGITTQRDTVNRGVMAGHSVVIDAGGDVVNTVKFDGINATAGKIQAGTGGLSVTAVRDVVNQGVITSDGVAMVKAGRDFVQNAATDSSTGMTVTAAAGSLSAKGSAVVRTDRDVILDQSSITTGQHAVIDAGRDARFNASTVDAGGSLAVTASRDIISTTVTDTATAVDVVKTKEGKKKTTTTTTITDETLRGSTFQAGGDIALVADRDITLTAATVHSDEGGIALAAKRDVNLLAATETHSVVQDSSSKKKGTLSSTKTTTHSEVSDTYALGTTLSGERISVAAGRDITTQAANVVATGDVAMSAGRNLTIGTAETEHRETFSQSKKKSGVFGNGGFSITAGTSKVEQGYQLTESGHQGSVIGSVDGKVALTAGETLHITGSDVLSNTGTAIVGKNVIIDAAVNTAEATQTYKEKSAGIHLGLTGGAVSAAEAAYGKGKAAGDVKDDRLKALYGAQAAMAAKDAYDGAQAMANGASAADAGISLRIGIGASSASATSATTDEAARGSTIRSNGNISIVATGGNLDVIGSQVEGNTVGLAATGDINLKSQAEQHRSESQNKNGSAEVGFSVGSTTGFYVTANAGKGKGGGNGTTHAETTIKGREGVTFVSGGSTTLEGAQIIAERVAGNVGGDFNIISQQDTGDYASKQQQAGGTFVYGYGGSVNYGQQKADSHYASVQEQSGVQAGQGGFQIDVEGNTHLKGGAIASTADPSMNRLTTGSLTVEDIANSASAKASGVNLGADSSMFSGSKYAAATGIAGNLLGSGSDADHRSSTTRADIADGAVIIGNGDSSALAGLSRAATVLDGNGVAPLDLQELQEQVAWEQGIKGEVYQQAVKFTDEAYRTMFLKEAKVYVVEQDSEGKQLPPRELTEEEKFNLKPAADGKIHIADNGINNDLAGANKYAEQHSTADGPQYFIHFPKAENGVSELLIAGYQKYLESDALGLANATDLTREYMLVYGQEGLHLDGHSRGSLTVGNAMESIENLSNSSGLLSGTTIGFFGPAYNAAAADALLSHLQDRESWANPQDGVLTLQNHKNDIVGGWIGLNPSTGGVTPENGNAAWEMARVLGGTNTPHNCYSASTSKCQDLWSDQPGRQSSPMPINQVPMSPIEELLYRLESWRGSLK